MPSSRTRRDDDDDDRPRSRRRDDDDDDDRPRSRRRDDDEDDDRPRSRRRDDDDDRPRSRRRGSGFGNDVVVRRSRRKSGPSIGKILAILGGGFVAVALVVALILLLTNSYSSGLGDISYEKFSAINENDTIDGLNKKLGRPIKYEREDWNRIVVGAQGDGNRAQGSTLFDYNNSAREVTAWYGWHKAQEEVYVAEGTDTNGRRGLVLKIYCNPQVVRDAILKPDAPKSKIPWFQLDQIGTGGTVRFGGG